MDAFSQIRCAPLSFSCGLTNILNDLQIPDTRFNGHAFAGSINNYATTGWTGWALEQQTGRKTRRTGKRRLPQCEPGYDSGNLFSTLSIYVPV
ncbi:hypothetical protein [Dyadobacter pollutisoli]|uniref:Uncharacterized protein n=1 Tax=Dyadobacter pollutisoli TaxID=2910158 RepID=A0A9E8SMP4_9BACT|nr:hypothetical protein [Dyadobacter pollutisoli]WAC13514.1 hypothetical protein ON006_06065 [Dyadobacter pollutisoli]